VTQSIGGRSRGISFSFDADGGNRRFGHVGRAAIRYEDPRGNRERARGRKVRHRGARVTAPRAVSGESREGRSTRRPRGWKADRVRRRQPESGESRARARATRVVNAGPARMSVCWRTCVCVRIIRARKRGSGGPRLRTKAQGRVSSVTEASPLRSCSFSGVTPPLGPDPLPFPFHPSSCCAPSSSSGLLLVSSLVLISSPRENGRLPHPSRRAAAREILVIV